MNPASKSSLPAITDPVIAAMVAQLKQENGIRTANSMSEVM